MSGVKRYDYGYKDDGFGGARYLGLIEKPDGKLVRASDYDRDMQALREDRDSQQRACIDVMAERDALRAQVEVIQADSDLYRQWFNAVQDLNPRYLEQKDYQAAVRLLERLNIRVPLSVVAGASKL